MYGTTVPPQQEHHAAHEEDSGSSRRAPTRHEAQVWPHLPQQLHQAVVHEDGPPSIGQVSHVSREDPLQEKLQGLHDEQAAMERPRLQVRR